MVDLNAQFLFLAVVNLPLICANPTGRSNSQSWDWVPCNSATFQNLNKLPSVEDDLCDLVNTLKYLSATYEQLPGHRIN